MENTCDQYLASGSFCDFHMWAKWFPWLLWPLPRSQAKVKMEEHGLWRHAALQLNLGSVGIQFYLFPKIIINSVMEAYRFTNSCINFMYKNNSFEYWHWPWRSVTKIKVANTPISWSFPACSPVSCSAYGKHASHEGWGNSPCCTSLSSIPTAHLQVEEGKGLYGVVLWPLHLHHAMCKPTHTTTTNNIMKRYTAGDQCS